MNAPDHTLESDGAGNFIVKVGGGLVGTVAKDGEYPGLWGAWDPAGQLLGRAASPQKAAVLLAAWCIADEREWT